MKAYNKPDVNYIEIKSEERFAAGSACYQSGTCGHWEGTGVSRHWVPDLIWVTPN